MLGTGPPLTGLGDPCSVGAGDVGAQLPGDAGPQGLGRTGSAPCVGGDWSGQMRHLTALTGPEHQVGVALAPLLDMAAENYVRRVCSRLSLGVAARGGGGGEGSPGSLPWLLSALLCGTGLWQGRPVSSRGSGVLGERPGVSGRK